MKILAVDLTSEFGSVAIRDDHGLRYQVEIDSRDGFGHLIYTAIETALRAVDLKLSQIDCFAGANGPGAFTGVRVGLAAVKGLAEASGKPATGVSNLRALSTFGRTERRAVVMDARRGDVFAATFNGALEALTEEVVMKLPAWLASLPDGDYEFIAQDGALIDRPAVVAPRYLAGAVALCAELDGQRGLWSDPAELDANYVRRTDAELLLG